LLYESGEEIGGKRFGYLANEKSYRQDGIKSS
jgi:hypothetical protein